MHRRVAPALLVLCIVLPPAAAAGQSDSSEVSRISDKRIDESSGLAISSKHDDLAYTINDGDNPIVYAIEISSGNVVGTTRVRGGAVEDTESIAIDGNGRMWLADLGDNDRERDDAALYAFREPGPGRHSVNAMRYPVSYEGGPADVETFLVHPRTGKKFLATRDEKAPGTLYSLPKKLIRNGNNRAAHLDKSVPVDTSDGTFTPSGSQALIRTGDAVHVFDPETWSDVERLSVPEVENGESIAMEPGGGSFIIGSEGEDSPLIRVTFGPQDEPTAEPTDEPTPEPTPEPEAAEETGVAVPAWVLIVGGIAGVGVLGGLAWWIARRD